MPYSFDRRKKKPKRLTGARAPVAGLASAQAAAEADRLPQHKLQQLLDRHRNGDDSAAPALLKALTYICYAASEQLDEPFAFDHLSEHLLALDVSIRRLASNEVAVPDLERYIRGTMWAERKLAATEHRTKIPRREREQLIDPEDTSWRRIELDEEMLSTTEVKVVDLLRKGHSLREIADITATTVHAVRRTIEELKRAA